MTRDFIEIGVCLGKFGFLLPDFGEAWQQRTNREQVSHSMKFELFTEYLIRNPQLLLSLIQKHIDPSFSTLLDPEKDLPQINSMILRLFEIRKPRFKVAHNRVPDSLEEVLEYLTAARLMISNEFSLPGSVGEGKKLEHSRRLQRSPHLTSIGIEVEVSPSTAQKLLDEDPTGQLLKQYITTMSQLQHFGPVLSYDGTLEIAFPPGLEGYESSATAMYELLQIGLLEEQTHNFHFTVGGIHSPHERIVDFIVLQMVAELGGLFGQRPPLQPPKPGDRFNMNVRSRKPLFDDYLQNVIDSPMIPFFRIKAGGLVEFRAMSKNWPGFMAWTRHFGTFNALTDAIAATSRLDSQTHSAIKEYPLLDLARVWKEVFETSVTYIDEYCKPESMRMYGGFMYFLDQLKNDIALVLLKQSEFDLRFGAFKNPALAQQHEVKLKTLLARSQTHLQHSNNLQQFLSYLEQSYNDMDAQRIVAQFRTSNSFYNPEHGLVEDWLLDEYIKFICQTIENTVTEFWAEVVYFSQQPRVHREVSGWLTDYRSQVRTLLRRQTYSK